MALAWKTALEAAGQLDDEMLQLIADKVGISQLLLSPFSSKYFLYFCL